jgi:hypothetical protein
MILRKALASAAALSLSVAVPVQAAHAAPATEEAAFFTQDSDEGGSHPFARGEVLIPIIIAIVFIFVVLNFTEDEGGASA